MNTPDPRSALRERKALVLQRFGLSDAQAMCGHDVPCFETSERRAPCPSCGSVDLVWLAPVPLAGRYRAVDGPDKASRLDCGWCVFSGDAVAYVMANYNISRLDFALDRIEDYLEGVGPAAKAAPRPAARAPKMAFKASPRRRKKRMVR